MINFKELWRNKPKNLGKLHEDETGILKHREWRGIADTLYDYYRWLVTWKDMGVMVAKAPVSTVKGLWNYRWMASYLSAPAWIDRHTEGLRGPQLKMTHLHMNGLVKPTTDMINFLLANDKHFHPNSKWADKTVNVDEIFSSELMAGFPGLKDNHVSTIPIFLSSMVDQNITPPYLDITESYGVPADVCPLPSAEAGVAINDDYPIVGKCSVTCNMPCDGSVMNSAYIDRRFDIPTHVINVPLRYNEEEAQEYAVEEVKECIKFIEREMNTKFNWDAFFAAMKNYNKQLDYEVQKWDVNKTDYPQMTGATFWLYRLFYFHISGGMDKRFLKIDKKVNRIMLKAYEKKTPCSKEMRHRAIVWSCPANYYTSLANWLENCWGINVVMDMETMISYINTIPMIKRRLLLPMPKPFSAQQCVSIQRAAIKMLLMSFGASSRNIMPTLLLCMNRFPARVWTVSTVFLTIRQESAASISFGFRRTLWTRAQFHAAICVSISTSI